jgi:hypothetical protein
MVYDYCRAIGCSYKKVFPAGTRCIYLVNWREGDLVLHFAGKNRGQWWLDTNLLSIGKEEPGLPVLSNGAHCDIGDHDRAAHLSSRHLVSGSTCLC